MTNTGPASLDQIKESVRQTAAGSDCEAAISRFHEQGLNKLQSIKALMRTTGMSLAEAKERVHRSRTWQDRFDAHEAFQDVIMQAAESTTAGKSV